MARKILLADDSVTAQNMGRRILTDAGYEVTTVNNGSAALKKIAESLPELIVLDVYMPGYSGLEVCQRLKETRETSRIPVLLTVGKLEPFKAEDARRARADAFIVKPFEASELLTALTKLEDKIVPQPTGKSGQFAKVWSELEQTPSAPGKSEKFGDAETGWKNRLIIPAPGSKQEAEPEPEEASTKSSKGKKDKKAKEEPKPMEVKASHEVAGVPADITAEEVAAIAAAAAAFEEKNQPPPEFAVKKSEVPEEPAPATAAVQPEKVEEKPVEVQAKESTPAAGTPAEVIAEAPKVAEPVAEIKPTEPAPVLETAPEVTATEIKPPVVETASAPAAATEPVVEAVSKQAEEKPAETSEVVVSAVAAPVVPRWTAQEVSLPPAEIGISLEQEMQKANAVLQAATAMVDLSAMAAEPPKPATVEQTPSPVVAEVEDKAEAKPEEKIPEVVPEVVAVAPAPEPERPQEPAAATAQPEPQPEVVTAVAAAASAGSSTQELPKAEVVSQPAPAVTESVTVTPEANANESELAAAWAQWKQIRETVVGSQLTSQIADVAAAELKSVEAATLGPDQETPAEKPTGNPTAIASIVDSVLAELKPKLVEEIARKLGDEKSKKK